MLFQCLPQNRCCFSTYHALFPNYRHSLLDAVCSLGNEGEVVFPHCLLGGGERAVGAAHHLQVPARTDGERWSEEALRGRLRTAKMCLLPCDMAALPG